MKNILETWSPSATDVIRADHARVMASFHDYGVGTPPAVKRALAGSICISLEVHAQVEEELFYPTMRSIGSYMIDDLTAEHARMRSLIAALGGVEPASGQFDNLFMELMRDVMHHVADEETRVLPEAERLLGPQLGELGARMVKRRLQLLRPHASELVRNKVRTAPKAGIAAGALALVAGGLLARKAYRRIGKGR